MRVLFAGGGTGGHINPAISIANYLREREASFEALFVGTKRGLETKLVPAAGYEIKYIDICGFDRRNMIRNISVLKKLVRSKRDCIGILKEFAPDAVVCTGGYVSGPVMLAAKKLGIPSLIHEQNVYPGLTVKGSEKYADYVALSFSETINSMKCPEKCVVTGNPVREELLKANSRDARRKLDLSDKPFVLVFGGSLGAKRLNDAMCGVIKRLGEKSPFQLLFATGERNYASVTEALSGCKISEDIKIVPYIHNMAEAMAAADLVVSRSGAITIAELAALKKPSVLIPSPNVVRNHQEQNAREIERCGGAAVILDKDLDDEVLLSRLTELTADAAGLKKMAEGVGTLAKTDALCELYGLVQKMCEK